MTTVKIENLEQLRELASIQGGLDIVIALKDGLRSSKHIAYDGEYYYLDEMLNGDGKEHRYSEQELYTETNIIKAMTADNLYAELFEEDFIADALRKGGYGDDNVTLTLELEQSYQPMVWEDLEDKIADLLAREGLQGQVTCSVTGNTTEIRTLEQMGRSD